MLFSATVVAFLSAASLISASPAKREGGLVISLAAPASVESVHDLELVATVKNLGTSDAKILKYGTILDSLPTRSFSVTKDGKAVAFQGAKLQVQPSKIKGDAYTVIPAGKSVQVKHKVGKLFDFAAHGTGNYKFEPLKRLVSSEASGRLGKGFATSANTVTVHVTKDVANQGIAARSAERSLVRKSTLDKRAVVTCDNADQAGFISASYDEGKALAGQARDYVRNAGAGDGLFQQYWKALNPDDVAYRFDLVAGETGGRTLNCADPQGICGDGIIAYTLLISGDQPSSNVYYCSIFYDEVETSRLCSDTSVAARNIRGGTTLHELTHATSGTDDVTYGCDADIALSQDDSFRNADNYNCFATQVYQNQSC